MITLKKLMLVAGFCAVGALCAPAAFAQTTDGYHSIQVIPITVDTASFVQRFTFRNPNGTTISIAPSYYPATGTSQATAIGCPTFTVAAGADRTFTSLRAICGALAAGSQFGTLYTYEINTTNMPYAAFSRVVNPQGNGFSVEAFPAETFTSAYATVTGVRRLASTPTTPQFQTNCFVGNLVDYTPLGSPIATDVFVTAYSSAGAVLGSTTVNMTPGHIVRLLDVFAAVGAPAGDYNDARVTFSESGVGEPALMAFCTVQDNTSFGADFRIAKQEGGDGYSYLANQDDHVMRDSTVGADIQMSADVSARTFSIPAGAYSNTHVIYFKHPDWIQCEIIDPATGVRALSGYGLEMRMLGMDGVTLIAGGNDSTGWGEVYLGDKADYNSGANGRYTIEVETSVGAGGGIRPYYLHCQSGSGHTFGDIVRYNQAADRF